MEAIPQRRLIRARVERRYAVVRTAQWITGCVAVVVLATACGGQPSATLTTPSPGAIGSPVATGPASPGSPAETPAVTITAPTDGATLPPGDLVVDVSVTGFSFGGGGTASPSSRVGHVLYYIDVDFVPTETGRSARTADGTFQSSSQSRATWPGVAAGRHALFVQLVKSDDTPLTPPVVDQVVVTVSETASPAAATTPPADP